MFSNWLRTRKEQETSQNLFNQMITQFRHDKKMHQSIIIKVIPIYVWTKRPIRQDLFQTHIGTNININLSKVSFFCQWVVPSSSFEKNGPDFKKRETFICIERREFRISFFFFFFKKKNKFRLFLEHRHTTLKIPLVLTKWPLFKLQEIGTMLFFRSKYSKILINYLKKKSWFFH